MHLFSKIINLTFAFSGAAIVVAACSAPLEDEPLEDIDSQSYALPCEDCEEPPPPECIPKCTGKTCGASDGCGGKCSNGSCPAGTICGGGGVPNVCACAPQCSGKACGAPDGCGGTCTSGSCPAGQACGAGGVPGQCATVPIGRGVECFVFNDGYTNMAGPTWALYFSNDGKVCMPDGTSVGTCRKWFGRCRTTDPSHTPVLFSVFNDGKANMAGPSDAVFSPLAFKACIPDGTPSGTCRKWFGAAKLPDGRPVECRLFDDDNLSRTKSTEDEMFKWSPLNSSLVEVCMPDGTNNGKTCRKWFGECMVAGCGDGACNNGETPSTCSSDCKCGDGVCNGGEWCGSCSQDCGSCYGNGVCDKSVGETCSTAPNDCGSCCGNGACDNGETCSSCSKDCGSCPVLTCSGQTAGPGAGNYTVGVEDYYGCLLVAPVYFANSLSEAAQCGQAAYPGYYIATSGTPTQYVYHTGTTNGCASLSFYALSLSKAASCGSSRGYPYPGPCP